MARRRLGTRRSGGFRLTVGAAVAIALAVGAVFLLRAQKQDSPATEISAAGDDAVAAGGRVGGGLFDSIDDFRRRAITAWTAADEIEKLRRQNAEMQEWRELALALAERMERYEALLKMPPEAYGQGVDPSKAVSARLILDAGGAFKRTLLANAGADHGVKNGYIAVNENGLIGRVVSLGKRSSRILLVDDYNSRIPIMGESSRARALLAGRAGQSPRLDTGPLTLTDPQVQFLVGVGGLRQGERIVTSGDGGVFPRGILVGWAQKAGDGWVVRLGAARAPIDYVRLIPSVNPEAPEAALAADQSLPPPPAALMAAAPAPAPAPKPKPLIAPPPAPAPALPPPEPTEAEDDAPPPVDAPGPAGE